MLCQVSLIYRQAVGNSTYEPIISMLHSPRLSYAYGQSSYSLHIFHHIWLIAVHAWQQKEFPMILFYFLSYRYRPLTIFLNSFRLEISSYTRRVNSLDRLFSIS